MLPSSTSLVPCCSLPQTLHLKTAAFTAGPSQTSSRTLPTLDLQERVMERWQGEGQARCHMAGRPSSPSSGRSDPPRKPMWDS